MCLPGDHRAQRTIGRIDAGIDGAQNDICQQRPQYFSIRGQRQGYEAHEPGHPERKCQRPDQARDNLSALAIDDIPDGGITEGVKHPRHQQDPPNGNNG